MSKQPKPDCKVGDTLRIEETPGWVGWASAKAGDTGRVTKVSSNVIFVVPDNDRYEESSWWRADRENQPRFTVIPNVSDKEIEQTKQALQQLLNQL